MEQEAKVPVGHRVAEEEEMAATELCAERDGDDARDLGLREVLDVVVLGDDEALPLAVLAAAADLAMELEDDRAALERELGRVRVRHLDQGSGSVRRDVAELATVPAGSEVRNDIELLTGVEERALERQVVTRGDDQLVRGSS